VISGEVVVLSGEESPEYIQRLARYIDKKMLELGRRKKVVSFNSFAKTLLVAINIADDLFKEIDANEDIRLEHARLQTDHEMVLSEFELLKSAARVANGELDDQLRANERLYKEVGAVKAKLAECETRLAEQTKATQEAREELANAKAEIETARRELSDYIDTFNTGDGTKKVYKLNNKK